MNVRIVNKHFKPLYQHDAEHMLTYAKGYIHMCKIDSGKSIQKIRIPLNVWQRILVKFRITERLLRLEPRGAVKLNDTKYNVSFHGSIYEIDWNDKKITMEHVFPTGMNNPLYMQKISGLAGWDDCILYGEYSGNVQKSPVSIYRKLLAQSNRKWEKCYEFPKGKINHIHNIIPDPYRKGVLILTGDTDEGSGIWLANEGFRNVTPLLLGKQCYRACAAIPLEDRILYATDTPLTKNGIYNAFCDNGVWKSEKIYDMPGPCIYYTHNSEKIIFNTTVEADAHKSGFCYLLSRKLGIGVRDEYSYLIEGDFYGNFKVITRIKKDFLPMGLFQFGAMIFAERSYADFGRIFLKVTALKQYDGKWLEVEG